MCAPSRHLPTRTHAQVQVQSQKQNAEAECPHSTQHTITHNPNIFPTLQARSATATAQATSPMYMDRHVAPPASDHDCGLWFIVY